MKKNFLLVISIVELLLLILVGILSNKGVFRFSKAMEKDWLGTLSGCIVSGVLILAPLLLDHVREEKQSTLPITIGFILSLIYGMVGMYIDFFPETVNSHIILLAMISAVTLVGLKYVFVYYTLLIPFGKWYGNLPDR
jgi:hypothetical protein